MPGDVSRLSGHEEIETRLHEQMERQLGEIIRPLMRDPTVTDIMLNEDGRIWVSRIRQPKQVAGTMEPDRAEALIKTVANHLKTTAGRTNPIVEGEISYYPCRFAGWLPPITQKPTFCIRVPPRAVYTLDQYVAEGRITPEQHETIIQAVDQKWNFLVGGSTGSGKTTLTNAIIDCIIRRHPDHRLLILEDTPEIQCRPANVVRACTYEDAQTSITIRKLLKATKRYRPDRIILGEVRGGEAEELVKMWMSGHGGGVCTIHANDAQTAMESLELLISEATKPVPRLIAKVVNCVAMMGATEQGPRLKEFVQVTGHAKGQYVLSSLTHGSQPP